MCAQTLADTYILPHLLPLEAGANMRTPPFPRTGGYSFVYTNKLSLALAAFLSSPCCTYIESRSSDSPSKLRSGDHYLYFQGLQVWNLTGTLEQILG